MKKALTVILILALMFTLCGCSRIDEMRDTTAYWQDDSKSSILWNGKVYVRTDYELDNKSGVFYLLSKDIRVIPNDLPLLLRNRSHDYAYPVWDNAILVVWSVVNNLSCCYCREDKLEEFKNNPPDNELTNVYVGEYANRLPAPPEYASAVLELLRSTPLTDEELNALGGFISYNGVKAYVSDDYGLYTGYITESGYENGWLVEFFLDHTPEAKYACGEELHKLLETQNEYEWYDGVAAMEPVY